MIFTYISSKQAYKTNKIILCFVLLLSFLDHLFIYVRYECYYNYNIVITRYYVKYTKIMFYCVD